MLLLTAGDDQPDVGFWLLSMRPSAMRARRARCEVLRGRGPEGKALRRDIDTLVQQEEVLRGAGGGRC